MQPLSTYELDFVLSDTIEGESDTIEIESDTVDIESDTMNWSWKWQKWNDLITIRVMTIKLKMMRVKIGDNENKEMC